MKNSSTPYHEKVAGEVKNQIFEKLDFYKTTFIESFISKTNKIITELKDKNETILDLLKEYRFPTFKRHKSNYLLFKSLCKKLLENKQVLDQLNLVLYIYL